jgi:hypothetical protein
MEPVQIVAESLRFHSPTTSFGSVYYGLFHCALVVGYILTLCPLLVFSSSRLVFLIPATLSLSLASEEQSTFVITLLPCVFKTILRFDSYFTNIR